MKLPHDCKLSVQFYMHDKGMRPVPYEMITLYSKELERGYAQFVRTQPIAPLSMIPGFYPLAVALARRVAIWRLIRLVQGMKRFKDRLG